MTERAIHIRKANSSEIGGIRELLTRCDLPAEDLELDKTCLLVALQDQKLIGTAGIELYPPYALLRSVAVAAQFRGTGIGGRLTRAAIEQAKARNIHKMYLLTLTAESFFKRFGFCTISRKQVPQSVLQSSQFQHVCPSSAVVMVLDMRPLPENHVTNPEGGVP